MESVRYAVPERRPPRLRWTALVVLVAFGPIACGFWKTVPLSRIESGDEKVQDVTLKLHRPGAPAKQELKVTRVDVPFVEGTTEVRGQRELVRVDLREMDEIEVYSPGRGAAYTTLGTFATLAVIAGVAGLIVALTKTSCPFVYVEGPGGPVLVGEAFTGATTRSTQRDDLMPLPPATGTRARLLFTNEALETQLTDRIELIVVEHGPALHALATPTAQVVLAEGAAPPLRVTDLEGADVTALVSGRAGLLWETDMEATAARAEAPARTGLEATFAGGPPGSREVLELDVANTPWLDLVNGRFVALMGEHLDTIRALDADPAAGEGIWRWRDREGIDLAVELAEGDGWRRIATVPTVGAFGVRHVGVPLPVAAGPEPRRLRITGGPGFWRLGRLALSALRDDAPPARRVAPAEARDGRGVDVRPLLAAVDGRHQVMPKAGDRVSLSFEVGEPPAGVVQERFLLTTGYYLIDRPPRSETSVRMVRTLWDEPGAFRRFAVDLYREYQRLAMGASSQRRVAR